MLLNPDKAAIIAVDCERYCFEKRAQGTARTEAVAIYLETAIPYFKELGIPVIALFSFAASKAEANLLECLRGDRAIKIRKNHESGFVGANLNKTLNQLGRTQGMVVGFHTSACVTRNAIDGVTRDFRMLVVPELVGEGQRGRSLSAQELQQKEQAALRYMGNNGVQVRSLHQ